MLRRGIVSVFLFLLSLSAVLAQEPVSGQQLRVGIHIQPPYVFQDNDGKWKGIAVDLWEQIAQKLHIPYRFVEMPYEDLIPEVAAGNLDVAIGELVPHPSAEKTVDFTHPYLSNYITAAIPMPRGKHDWVRTLRNLFSESLLRVFLIVLAAMLIAAVIIWIVERRDNQVHFGGGLKGFGSAIWFAAVTMTTVGYGDKTPSTLSGRLITFLWMMAGVVLLATFTATVASSVAITRVQSVITHPSDLYRIRVGALNGSASAQLLKEMRVHMVPYEDVVTGMRHVQKGDIGAFVGDRITLDYLIDQEFSDTLTRAPLRLEDIYIAFATPQGSPLREQINRELLQILNSREWRAHMTRYLPPH